jgi:hypothetical protein
MGDGDLPFVMFALAREHPTLRIAHLQTTPNHAYMFAMAHRDRLTSTCLSWHTPINA